MGSTLHLLTPGLPLYHKAGIQKCPHPQGPLGRDTRNLALKRSCLSWHPSSPGDSVRSRGRSGLKGRGWSRPAFGQRRRKRGYSLFLKDKGNGHRRNTEVLTGAAEMRRFLPGAAFFLLA